MLRGTGVRAEISSGLQRGARSQESFEDAEENRGMEVLIFSCSLSVLEGNLIKVSLV